MLNHDDSAISGCTHWRYLVWIYVCNIIFFSCCIYCFLLLWAIFWTFWELPSIGRRALPPMVVGPSFQGIGIFPCWPSGILGLVPRSHQCGSRYVPLRGWLLIVGLDTPLCLCADPVFPVHGWRKPIPFGDRHHAPEVTFVHFWVCGCTLRRYRIEQGI